MANDNVVIHLMQAIRAQMKALDILLAAFERQVAEPPIDDKIRCPECSIELSDGNRYSAMGSSSSDYACPNCSFRGRV